MGWTKHQDWLPLLFSLQPHLIRKPFTFILPLQVLCIDLVWPPRAEYFIAMHTFGPRLLMLGNYATLWTSSESIFWGGFAWTSSGETFQFFYFILFLSQCCPYKGGREISSHSGQMLRDQSSAFWMAQTTDVSRTAISLIRGVGVEFWGSSMLGFEQ